MANTISRTQLIDTMVEGQNLSKKDVKSIVKATLGHISEHLMRRDKAQVTGFGAFEVRERQARMGVKPGTTERVQIPESKGIHLRKTCKVELTGRLATASTLAIMKTL